MLKWVLLLLNPNDLLVVPAVGETFWYIWWLLLLVTCPAWLILLVLMLAFDLLTLRIATSQWEVKPDAGKAILITDCEAPYGTMLVQELLDAGWGVYAGCKSAAAYKAFGPVGFVTKSEGKAGKGGVVPLLFDVTQPDTVAAAAARIGADHPHTGLFALVHTAVCMQGGMAEWLSVEDFRACSEVNYLGRVNVTVAMLPLLKKTRGSRIVFVTSVAGVPPALPLLSAYSSSCQAASAFAVALQPELSPWGVHVSTVVTGMPPRAKGGMLAQQAEATLMESWGRLNDERRLSFGEDFGEECREVMENFTEERLLRPRHVVAGVRQATLAASPKPQYLVGLDARIGKSFLRALPPRFRDMLIRWWTSEKLTPAAMLMETYVGSTMGPTVEEEDAVDDPLNAAEFCKRNSVVGEEYEVMEVLGKGAFAVVRKGKRKDTGLPVALKFINRQAMASRRAKTALTREIQIMSLLCSRNHPHLMGFVCYYQDPQSMVMVLEFLSGGDLFENVLRDGHFSERRASVAIEELMLALQAVHESGVVHRDVKPENLVYGCKGKGGKLKLADFGLAVVVRTKSNKKDPRQLRFHGSQLAGTPMYMSPEIINDREYSPAVDVWAAGVVLYVLLSGSLPFTGRTHEELFAQVADGRWSIEGGEWTSVSKAAKEAVRGMLTADSMQRLTAAEVLQLPFITQREQVPDVALPQGSREGIRLLKAKAHFKAAARACILNARHIKHDVANSGMSETFENFRLNTADAVRAKTEMEKEMGSGAKGLDRESFKRVMTKLGWATMPFDRVFDLFDSNDDGIIDKKELLLGLTKLEHKDDNCWRFCFDLLDEDKSGTITYGELAKVLINYRRVNPAGGDGKPRAATPVEEAEQALPEDKALDCDPQDFELLQGVAELFAVLDKDGNGEISLEEFLEGTKKRPDLMKLILGEANIKSFNVEKMPNRSTAQQEQAS